MMQPAVSMSFRLTPLMVILAGLLAWVPPAGFAGGGPENLFLVVNRNSADSLTIANHYIKLRQIHPGNVLTLPWDPEAQTTDVDTFRQKILIPVLAAIEKRRLVRQIDYIIYSSDFPWAVNLAADAKRFTAAVHKAAERQSGDRPMAKSFWPKHSAKVGSINGLTYLYQPVLAGSPAYVHLQANYYMRLPRAEQREAPTLAFSSVRHFGPRGELRDDDEGRQYMLSMMLGVTAGRGNSLDEVLGYLRRSVDADGTHPRGTIYFMQNMNVRSKVRAAGFAEAVKELKALGVAAEVLEGTLPMNKHDVQGAMIGAAAFNWKLSGSTILPGAICEHFTSFGGVMRSRAGQTPLSALLRYGAAGASGTVAEPYALHPKFPRATIHVHYARGCSLAEAFYQSVHGPYQLLIVGDPLCRPWANIPQGSVEGVENGESVTGTLKIKPSASVPGGGNVERFELFVDGLLTAGCPAGRTLKLDTTRLADGYHELRIVAIEAGLIQSRGRRIVAVSTANHGREIDVSVAPSESVYSGRSIHIAAKSPGSIAIAVIHNSRLLNRINGSSGRLEINSGALGSGPVILRVVALGKGGPEDYVWAKPIELTVEH